MQHANREPYVRAQIVQQSQPERFPALVLTRVYRTELDVRPPLRLVKGYALAHEIFGELIDMEAQFVVHIRFKSPAARGGSKPRFQPRQRPHDSTAFVFRIPPTISVIRSHL